MWLGFLVIGVCSLHLGTADRDHDETSLESRLEERLVAVTRRLELLESRDQSQQAEIDSLNTELHAQKQHTATLEKLVRLLQGKTENNNESLTNVKVISGGRKLKVKPDHRPTTESIIIQRERKAEHEMTVAFYATLTDSVVHAGAKQNILFNQVITNVGNAYSPSLGSFVAPVSGIYVFSVTLTAYATEEEHYILSKNGVMVSGMYARAHESPYMVTGTTAVLQLSKGDNVEIQTNDADGSVHGLYSSHAGFLLQQNFGSVPAVG